MDILLKFFHLKNKCKGVFPCVYFVGDGTALSKSTNLSEAMGDNSSCM